MGLSECSMDMLRHLKLKSVDELFADVPAEVRIAGLNLPDGMAELDLKRQLENMMASNKPASTMPTFLGGGVYHHFIPAAVKMISARSEFATSYTPYQPEISQGILQAMFEYQSFMVELTGMDVVNSSMYDASTALGEAILMASRISGGDRFLLSRAINPQRREVAELYAKGADIKLVDVGYCPDTGLVDLDDLRSKIVDGVTGFYFESPNFFGVLEAQGEDIRRILGTRIMVVGVNPMSLALVKPPGDYGADIVTGDAQVFGVPMDLGGPLIGLFGCRMEHVRKMPGRLVGMTTDAEGTRSYCMTLQTREQNIRRSKATSNICTNEALLSVAVAAYLSQVGRSGLRRVAKANIEKAHELSARIGAMKGFRAPRFRGPHFNEFVATSDVPSERIHRGLLERGVHGGLVLDSRFPELGHSTLYTTTEMHSREDHDKLVSALEEIS